MKNTQSMQSNVIAFLKAGFAEAGVSLVTNHPGFRSNELAHLFHGAGLTTSPNERTAFAVAWGHAVAGKRSATTLKNVGLNDAADCFLNAQMLDINAGFVVVVFDDIDVEHSQLRMDSRHYHSFYGTPWLEPKNLHQARCFARDAFDISEHLSTPVVIRITNLLTRRGAPAFPNVAYCHRPTLSFKRTPESFVVHPSYHMTQLKELKRKQDLFQEWSMTLCETNNNPPDPDKNGFVRFIAGAAHIKNEEESSWTNIHLPCLPLPRQWILDRVRSAKRIQICEHGDPLVYNAIRQITGDVSTEYVPPESDHANRKYHSREEMLPIYRYLRSLPEAILVGDLGGYTMDPDHSIDACLCYGASIGTATGVSLALPYARVACFCGDGAFLHSAKPALFEARDRGCNITVFIMDNGGCHETGGQKLPGSTTVNDPSIPEAFANYDPSNPDKVIEIIQYTLPIPGPKIIHLITEF